MTSVGGSACYFDARHPEDLHRLRTEAGLFEGAGSRVVVIDGVQHFPEGPARIRSGNDAARRAGRRTNQVVLLGSSDSSTRSLVSEAFGTAVTVVTLHPVGVKEYSQSLGTVGSAKVYDVGELPSDAEVLRNAPAPDIDTLWLRGGFPFSLFDRSDSESFAWRQTYLRTLYSRPDMTSTTGGAASGVSGFIENVAAGQGESIASEDDWRDYRALANRLVDIGILRKVKRWSGESRHRDDRYSRLYIRDSGLLHAALHIRTLDELRADHEQMRRSWASFCVEEIARAAEGAGVIPFYFRDEGESEVDLLLEYPGQRRIGIAIRLSADSIDLRFHSAIDKTSSKQAFVVKQMQSSDDKKSYRIVTLLEMIELCENPFRLFEA